METKEKILNELNSRIERLYEHQDDVKENDGNQYAELNHAVSRVIGTALTRELEDVRNFVNSL